MKKADEAKEQGKKAHKEGQSILANPYTRTEHPMVWEMWERGWKEEERDMLAARNKINDSIYDRLRRRTK